MKRSRYKRKREVGWWDFKYMEKTECLEACLTQETKRNQLIYAELMTSASGQISLVICKAFALLRCCCHTRNCLFVFLLYDLPDLHSGDMASCVLSRPFQYISLKILSIPFLQANFILILLKNSFLCLNMVPQCFWIKSLQPYEE